MTRTHIVRQVRLLVGAHFLAMAMAACAGAADIAWSGAVRNASGDPLGAATVRLVNDRVSLTAITNNAGQFHFGKLQVGSYRLSIAPSGQKSSQPSLVQITANTAPAEIVLSDSNTLNISDAKAASATGGEDLSSQAVSELPLNKR